jgi:hypothetical protein
MFAAAHLQTKAGKVAEATTTEEFEELMKVFVQIAIKDTIKRTGLPPFFSWDNCSVFKAASLEEIGIPAGLKLPHAEYSPDMHKPIEHAWAQLKHNVQEELLQPAVAQLHPREAQRLVSRCFKRIRQDSICRDVLSLPVTYHVIAGAEGVLSVGPDDQHHMCSGGDWPARQYR